MSNYYLDIETTGLDHKNNQILTIQYQELDFNNGEAVGKLVILKAWESSEKDIVEKFSKMFDKNNVWKFVAHGYNLKFEHDFLLEKSVKYGLADPIKILDNPAVDLHPVGIMLNGGNFKGSGLDKISGKGKSGMYVLECHAIDKYDEIVEYIIQEAREYIKLFCWLKKEMPKLLVLYKESVGTLSGN